MNQTIQKFADLFTNGETATIHCAMSGTKVRTLTKEDDNCHLVAGDGTTLDIPLNTTIQYEPWVMDRGSLNFTLNGQALKLCTELDVLKTDNGEYSIVPNMLEVEISLLARSESDLTISVMRRIATQMGLTNPELVNDLYESVIFYTGSHDPDHGFGSSDFTAVYRSFEQSYLKGLQPGEQVIETEPSSCMKGKTGTVYISENEGPAKGSTCVKWSDGMGTSVTHGTRRIKDIA
jgi:hypothetical protein